SEPSLPLAHESLLRPSRLRVRDGLRAEEEEEVPIVPRAPWPHAAPGWQRPECQLGIWRVDARDRGLAGWTRDLPPPAALVARGGEERWRSRVVRGTSGLPARAIERTYSRSGRTEDGCGERPGGDGESGAGRGAADGRLRRGVARWWRGHARGPSDPRGGGERRGPTARRDEASWRGTWRQSGAGGGPRS